MAVYMEASPCNALTVRCLFIDDFPETKETKPMEQLESEVLKEYLGNLSGTITNLHDLADHINNHPASYTIETRVFVATAINSLSGLRRIMNA